VASRKQIAANHANAMRSTGPRSSGGKARSKRNAVTHDLTAAHIVVMNEQPEQFEAFREGLVTDFNPDSTIEYELVDRLAGLLWRLRAITLAAPDSKEEASEGS